MVKPVHKEKFFKEAEIFRKHGGILRTTQALKLGIHPRSIYAMRDLGIIEQLSRGVFRLTDLPPLEEPDLVTVASRIPNGVICLISAMSFHELTTQIPHEVYVAVQRGSEKPRCNYPPVRFFWFSGPAFSEGSETKKISGTPIRIYSPEKTLADCFKYRNKIGVDVAVEGLKKWMERRSPSIEKLTKYAQICGVEKVLKPYLEALL